jgi:hypothetical protein
MLKRARFNDLDLSTQIVLLNEVNEYKARKRWKGIHLCFEYTRHFYNERYLVPIRDKKGRSMGSRIFGKEELQREIDVSGLNINVEEIK